MGGREGKCGVRDRSVCTTLPPVRVRAGDGARSSVELEQDQETRGLYYSWEKLSGHSGGHTVTVTLSPWSPLTVLSADSVPPRCWNWRGLEWKDEAVAPPLVRLQSPRRRAAGTGPGMEIKSYFWASDWALHETVNWSQCGKVPGLRVSQASH